MGYARKKIERLVQKSYSLALAWKYFKVRYSHANNRQSIVIYQMGKVGSSTIKDSLVAHPIDANVYHVHGLCPELLKEYNNVYKRKSKVEGRVVIHDQLVEGFYLRKKIEKGGTRSKWKVITLIRDPISRNVSTFFQAFDLFYPELAKTYRDTNLRTEDRIDQLIELFFENFNHDRPLVWFDRYFKPVFNIDVYSEGFQIDQGYTIYKNANVDLLVLRLENLNSSAPSAMREFLKIDNFSLKTANVADKKDYFPVYEKFKKQLKLPVNYIEKMYSSKFARHFYTDDELDSFRQRWIKS